jgi:uncharacterized damage-inducible protein DinB
MTLPWGGVNHGGFMATTTSIPALAPQAAAGLREFLMGSLTSETAATRNVILAITNPQFKLDDKSSTAIDRAQHIVSVEVQFVQEIAEGEFKMEPRYTNLPTDPKALVAWYDKELPKAIEAVQKMSPEQLSKVLDFYGAFQFPAVMYLNFAIKHSVHHRGQLSAYLRPMGSKVPSIYGGSADEPWQA